MALGSQSLRITVALITECASQGMSSMPAKGNEGDAVSAVHFIGGGIPKLISYSWFFEVLKFHDCLIFSCFTILFSQMVFFKAHVS